MYAVFLDSSLWPADIDLYTSPTSPKQQKRTKQTAPLGRAAGASNRFARSTRSKHVFQTSTAEGLLLFRQVLFPNRNGTKTFENLTIGSIREWSFKKVRQGVGHRHLLRTQLCANAVPASQPVGAWCTRGPSDLNLCVLVWFSQQKLLECTSSVLFITYNNEFRDMPKSLNEKC